MGKEKIKSKKRVTQLRSADVVKESPHELQCLNELAPLKLTNTRIIL